MDDDEEVDPELFNLCRLCLENKGNYLFKPQFREQAKYCYDITIDPLDELPQLLCTDCKNKLAEIYNVKKTYIEKQKILLERKTKKKVPVSCEHEADSSSQLDSRPVLNIQSPNEEKTAARSIDQDKKEPEKSDISFKKIPLMAEPECLQITAPSIDQDIKEPEKNDLSPKKLRLTTDPGCLQNKTPSIDQFIKQPEKNDISSKKLRLTTEPRCLQIQASSLDQAMNISSKSSCVTTEPGWLQIKAPSVDQDTEEPDQNGIVSKNFRVTTEPGCLQIKIQGNSTNPVGNKLIQEDKVGDSSSTKQTTDQSRKSSTGKSESSFDKNLPSKTSLSQSDFEHSYTCKICNKSFNRHYNVKRHVNRLHKKTLTSLQELCPKPCKVILQRLEKYGSTKKKQKTSFDGVALSKSRIIAEYENEYYSKWIVLKNQDNADESQSSSDDNFSRKSNQSCFSISDSSDNERLPKCANKRSRRRISSDRSETSTVELKDSPKKIKSSDSINEAKAEKSTAENSSARKDVLSISDNVFLKKLVYNTYNKYRKPANEVESLQAKPNDILNRKLLNLGTKTMLKQGIQSVGLLKYLEKRHLQIIWCNIKKSDYNTISGHVRVNTKLINGNESPNSFDGFQVFQHKTQYELKAKSAKITLKKQDETIQLFESASSSNTTTLLNATPVPNPKQASFKPRTYSGPVPNKEDTINSPTTNISVPKELDSVTITPQTIPKTEEKTICLDSDDENTECVMPVITSTTSLAIDNKILKGILNNSVITSKENITAQEKDPKQVSKELQSFRIKCKPVSELLASGTSHAANASKQNIVLNNAVSGPPPPYLSASVSVLKSPIEVANPTIQQEALNQFIPVQPAILTSQNEHQYGYVAITPSMIAGPASFSEILKVSGGPNQNAATSSLPNQQHMQQATNRPTDDPIDRSKCSNKQNDFIQLTSVAFPSILTASPIRYLAKLLQIHKIKLELLAEPVPPSFFALIRFKLSVQQKPIQKTLSVQLYVGENVAYIRVATSDLKVVKLENMLGSWQWEVLKSFQEGHVVAKVLAASKNIGGRVADTAKTFINLLGTIEQVKN